LGRHVDEGDERGAARLTYGLLLLSRGNWDLHHMGLGLDDFLGRHDDG
jgi:hypothetical protein